MDKPYLPLRYTGPDELESPPQDTSIPKWSTIYIVVKDDEFPKHNKAINLLIAGSAKFDIVVSKKIFGVRENYRILVCDRLPFMRPEYEPGRSAIKYWLYHTTEYQVVHKFTDALRTTTSIKSVEVPLHMRVLFHNDREVYFIDENHKRRKLW